MGRKAKLPAGLVWRGNTIYVRTMVNGQRIIKTCQTDSVEQAREILEEIRYKVRQGIVDAKELKVGNKMKMKDSGLTDEQILDIIYKAHWVSNVDGENSLIRVKRALKMMGCGIAGVDAMKVDKLIGDLQAQGSANSTINNYVNCLYKVLNTAKRYGIIKRVPEKPKGLRKVQNIKFLTNDEIDDLLEYFRDITDDLDKLDKTIMDKKERQDVKDALRAQYVNQHTRVNKETRQTMEDLIPVLLDTGMRLGEALALTQDHKVNGYLRLAATETKTKKARSIGMTPRVREILEKRIAQGYTNPIFPITRNAAMHCIQKYKKNRGIDDPAFKLHALRHTFASRLAQLGVDLYKISKLLGHQSVSTTQIYAHLVQQDLDGPIKLLSGDSYGTNM
jgi:integrase